MTKRICDFRTRKGLFFFVITEYIQAYFLLGLLIYDQPDIEICFITCELILVTDSDKTYQSGVLLLLFSDHY